MYGMSIDHAHGVHSMSSAKVVFVGPRPVLCFVSCFVDIRRCGHGVKGPWDIDRVAAVVAVLGHDFGPRIPLLLLWCFFRRSVSQFVALRGVALDGRPGCLASWNRRSEW